ncbi:hypothetical protein ACE106_15140 [Shouchella clausii]|uniref:hypothetical protein n=1 Tax=Shouchella clausii TaxID=79880 RepID=UPI0028A28E71|nr:hypothetical protein [Shouchella clausii]
MSNRYFRVFSGLLTSEHRKRMGPALWTFLWLIDHITDETEETETGQRTGLVLYGNITEFNTIGVDLGLSKSTIKKQCETLAKEGYISMEVTPRGNRFYVNNSKKWNNPTGVRAENRTDRAENKTKCAENRTDGQLDRAENRTDRAENRTLRAKNGPSITNKDINKEILTTETTTTEFAGKNSSDFFLADGDEPDDADKLVNHYLGVVQKIMPKPEDYKTASSLLETIPLDKAIMLVDYAKGIATKRGKTKIFSFSYLAPIMLEAYQAYKAREAKNNVVKLVPKGEAVHAEDSPAYQLAQLLLDRIRQAQEDFAQPNMQDWAEVFVQMLKEGKKAESIQEAIMYARDVPFWMDKVISPHKVATHYNTLRQQIAKQAQSVQSPRHNTRKAPEPAWLTETPEKSSANQPVRQDSKKRIAELMAKRKRQREERSRQHGGY